MRIQVLAVNSDLPFLCGLLTAKTLFSTFIMVHQIHSQRKHTCVRYTSQMKRYHDLTQRLALCRKPLSTAHDIFIDQVHRSCLRGRRWNPGGGGTPLYKLYRHVPPHRVGFLRRFGVKTGIHFGHFGLESGMLFEGVSIPNEYERKKNMRIRNGFEEFFRLRSNLSNDNIISA